MTIHIEQNSRSGLTSQGNVRSLEKRFFSEDRLVFEADSSIFEKATENNHAVVEWRVDHNKKVAYLISKLEEFYQSLRSGGFQNFDVKPEYIVMPVGQDIPEKFQMPETLHIAKNSELAEQLGYFSFINFQTPYCTFGFQPVVLHASLEIPWTPEHGKLFVNSHQDISIPVSRLIAETCRVKCTPELILPALQEIYGFRDAEIFR